MTFETMFEGTEAAGNKRISDRRWNGRPDNRELNPQTKFVVIGFWSNTLFE